MAVPQAIYVNGTWSNVKWTGPLCGFEVRKRAEEAKELGLTGFYCFDRQNIYVGNARGAEPEVVYALDRRAAIPRSRIEAMELRA